MEFGKLQKSENLKQHNRFINNKGKASEEAIHHYRSYHAVTTLLKGVFQVWKEANNTTIVKKKTTLLNGCLGE